MRGVRDARAVCYKTCARIFSHAPGRNINGTNNPLKSECLGQSSFISFLSAYFDTPTRISRGSRFTNPHRQSI